MTVLINRLLEGPAVQAPAPRPADHLLEAAADRIWLSTRQMAQLLQMHPVTLNKLKAQGFFTENRHWRKLNPTAITSHLRWHRERTLLRMGAA